MAVLIVIALVVTVADTEPSISGIYGVQFQIIEVVIASVFMLEYLLRVWVMGLDDRYQGILGRIRYISTPYAIVDLLAFLPTLLALGASDALILRILRLARLVRFAKLGQYSSSLRLILRAFLNCWRELVISFLVAVFLLIACSTGLYWIEGDVQPEAFGSIPRAMWCAVATLTTFGYGDVYPITSFGQFFMGIVALVGIGLVGLPTAILAGAFSDEFKNKRL